MDRWEGEMLQGPYPPLPLFAGPEQARQSPLARLTRASWAGAMRVSGYRTGLAEDSPAQQRDPVGPQANSGGVSDQGVLSRRELRNSQFEQTWDESLLFHSLAV